MISKWQFVLQNQPKLQIQLYALLIFGELLTFSYCQKKQYSAREPQVRPRETLLPLMHFAKLDQPPSLLGPHTPSSKVLEKNKPPGRLNRGFTVCQQHFFFQKIGEHYAQLQSWTKVVETVLQYSYFLSFLGSLLKQCILFKTLYKAETRKKFWIHASNIVCGVRGGVGPV